MDAVLAAAILVLEALLLVTLWGPQPAGWLWIGGRILYMTGYSQAAERRGRGFGIQAMATGILWVGALGGIIWRLIHA